MDEGERGDESGRSDVENSQKKRSKTYGEYLHLEQLLALQDDAKSPDELHFIIVHQTFELWFKQIITELSAARDKLAKEQVPEREIPVVVAHLGRVTEIFKLMANQWTVMETLTPQGFLAFRDGLGSASGFESFQMRELEILLGLRASGRVGEMDVLAHFRKMAGEGEAGERALARLERRMAEESLVAVVTRWLSRTPIMGSIAGSDGDEVTVAEYVDAHLDAHRAVGEAAAERMVGWGMAEEEAMRARMAVAQRSAETYLRPPESGDEDDDEAPLGPPNRARAGLLFIESYRELPLLTWPRTLVDSLVELEEAMVKWRHSHARMVERIIGRRMGTGGSSGVDYLDMTATYRVLPDLWAVRTILVKPELRPALKHAKFYNLLE
jgi:tryptophan 2,3-dioxygenase